MSERTIDRIRPATESSTTSPRLPHRKNPALLAASGLAAVLLLVLGTWLMFGNKSGQATLYLPSPLRGRGAGGEGAGPFLGHRPI